MTKNDGDWKKNRGAVKRLAWLSVFGSWSLAQREQSSRWQCEDGLSQVNTNSSAKPQQCIWLLRSPGCEKV
ncbi:hypothetical protein INR49_030148 [Xyrichtys novacula]|uniref:Uncharacterized protein n=1 Tax=Xyrichtys novacula TaxID=13765 RepID=A0AAV1F7S8_XYRNO|nr:hypothetical protein INR49_030148 [Xyrichtys novacula]